MKKLLLFVVTTLFSAQVFAHPGHEMHNAFDGFMHPFTGLDHLLVMFAIGLWASKLGGKALWQLPLTFMGMMLFGVLLAWNGLHVPGTETIVALSVIIVALLFISPLPLQNHIRLFLVGSFAMFHGMAHGAELSGQQGLSVMAGMLLATGLLHGLGLVLGSHHLFVQKFRLGFALTMLTSGVYLFMQ